MPCDIIGGQCGAWGNKSIWPSACKTANMCQNSSNLQKLPKVPKTAKMPKAPNFTKLPFLPKSTVFSGDDPQMLPGSLMGQELQLVSKCCVWFQPAQEGPGGLPWPPKVSSVFSSQIRAQEPCPAFFSLPRAQGPWPAVQLAQGWYHVLRDLQGLFQWNHVLSRVRKGQETPGLYRTI